MKFVEKYDARAECASRKFLDMLIDHRNLSWKNNFLKFPWLFLNFPDFQENSKFPWQILKFPWLFPDKWQPFSTPPGCHVSTERSPPPHHTCHHHHATDLRPSLPQPTAAHPQSHPAAGQCPADPRCWWSPAAGRSHGSRS